MLLICKDISVNIYHLLMSVLFMIMMDGLFILAKAKSKMEMLNENTWLCQSKNTVTQAKDPFLQGWFNYLGVSPTMALNSL